MVELDFFPYLIRQKNAITADIIIRENSIQNIIAPVDI